MRKSAESYLEIRGINNNSSNVHSFSKESKGLWEKNNIYELSMCTTHKEKIRLNRKMCYFIYEAILKSCS